MTHAKARFLRRISNRKINKFGSAITTNVGAPGDPIPGVLSAVELAKKERRHNRRVTILKRKQGATESADESMSIFLQLQRLTGTVAA